MLLGYNFLELSATEICIAILRFKKFSGATWHSQQDKLMRTSVDPLSVQLYP